MMNITVNDDYAYLEVEVFGAYNETDIVRFFDDARRLVERYGKFSELEVHHGGKPQNMFKTMMATHAKLSKDDPNAMAFLKHFYKYALVSDNPGLMYRTMFAFNKMGKLQLRLFKSHERELARAWIEDRDATDQFVLD
ncbi:MAG: STAS/SEC14 domain-containing protein [Marinicaulis sp.]|nr:STAS/SEC14 domain-containing protein [Marinicaulis sp.]NNE40133.1 STAS/SEC14 domain-containing protein [Marinicaulis sp.]NNL87435.1 STAS/SEC14 domain-containing protein [Marinicaulis sp.]